MENNEFITQSESLELKTVEILTEEIKAAIERRPGLSSDLKCVIWGGSRGLEENRLIGNQTSDMDIVTLLSPHRNEDPFNLAGLEALNEAFRNAAKNLMESNIVPIIVATIRLEQAEITMAEMFHAGRRIIPIHWLFYPSPEFGLINEPPDLLRNLVQGEVLIGDNRLPQEIIRRSRAKETPEHLAPLLGGLDWLTDTFRLFETNGVGQLPRQFLVRQATHNLEYFLKWRVIAMTIEKRTRSEPKTWKQMTEFQNLFPPEIWVLAQSAKLEREKGTWSQEDTIKNLFQQTFTLWPRIVSIREEKQ